MTIKKKKKIKRRPGKRSKLYFTSKTQDAIEEYQDSTDPKRRKELLTKQIIPAFRELAENLIFVFRFKALHDSQDVLLNDCVSFLFENIHKFDRTKGFKAYSYFSIVAKNFLIIRSKKRNAAIQRHLSIDDTDTQYQEELKMFEENHIEEPIALDNMKNHERLNEISNLFQEIKDNLTNPIEIECLEAIKFIFENLQDVPLLKKRALTQYIKESTNLNSKQMTFAMAQIKKHYREIQSKYIIKIFNT